ncbi:MAG: 3-phosphoshikimate 1-carboxyvinyltransferase [Planctomycetota bacterium]
MKSVMPSKVNGTVKAPPSKSMMVRAVAASLLAPGRSEILNPSFCGDSLAALGVAKALQAHVSKKNNKVIIEGSKNQKTALLDCAESGLCIRMFAPIVSLFGQKFILTGAGSLSSRPVGMIEQPLVKLGALCKTNNGYPPVIVRGPIDGGNLEIDGAITSQFLTGLLMALPLCGKDSTISVSNLESKLYIQMTIAILKDFGITVNHDRNLSKFRIPGRQEYRPRAYTVEGDWSGASFLLVAGAIGGRVKVIGLSMNSLQADKAIINLLKEAGSIIKTGQDFILVKKSRLDAFKFDITNCPDLFPPLAALACNCKGKSIIAGIERVRHKESDRAMAISAELGKLGAKIKIAGNRMEITGAQLKGGIVNSHNDHRIAMACAIAAINSETGARIKRWESVSKSYPEFFNDLKSMEVDVL